MYPTVQPIAALPQGMALDKAAKGPFLLNVWPTMDGWEVRPGLGQIAKVSSTQRWSAAEPGFRQLLGCKAITTRFGHEQVVSLWSIGGFSGNTLLRSTTARRYAVVIHDATTRASYDVVLHRQTGERGEDVQPPPYWKPVYATSQERDRQGWVVADRLPVPFFAQVQGALLFGSQEMGLWVYDPVDIGRQGDSAVDGVLFQDCHRPDGECPFVTRVFPVPGVFSDGFSYLGTAQFPQPTDVCAVGSMAAMVSGRTIYLSDAGAPASIRSSNLLDLPCRGELVGVDEVFGTILAWTADETWAIRLPPNGLLDYADVRQLSDSIGLLGPQAKTRADGAVLWADRNGVFGFDGGSEVRAIGSELAPLFYDGLSIPLSSHYADVGKATLTSRQPSSFVRWADPWTAMTYDPVRRAVLLTLPQSNAGLCFCRGAWSVWSFESNCASAATAVVADNKVPFLRLSATNVAVYGVAGPDLNAAAPTAGSTYPEGSAVILELGRGGGVDRNADSMADQRLSQGGFSKLKSGAGTGMVILGNPVDVEEGEKLGTQAAPARCKLVPVYFVPPEGVFRVVDLEFIVEANTNITFVPAGFGSSVVDAIFATERDKARDGWGFGGALNTGVAEIQTYTGGVPAAGGKQLVARFDGNNVNIIEVWPTTPYLSVAPRALCPLFWIPITSGAGLELTKLWDTVSAGVYTDDAANTVQLDVWAYQGSCVGSRDDTTTVGQPVDWALATDYHNSEAVSQTILRGARFMVVSHGEAPDIRSSSRFGLFNAVFRADWRDWGAQLGDFVFGNRVGTRTTVQARLRTLTAALDPVRKVFGNASAVWGGSASTSGSVLIDDEPLDPVDCSEQVRGDGVGVMAFGHIRGASERVHISEVQLMTRVGGAPRRTGP